MEYQTPNNAETNVPQIHQLTKVTTLSKYFALALMVALPFVGEVVGYSFAPEKVVERVVVQEVEVTAELETESSSMETRSAQFPFDFRGGTDIGVSTEGSLMQLSFAQGLDMGIPYLSTWEVDSFEGKVTKGAGYELLARVDNPATPGKPDTDVPREFIMVSIVDRVCEGAQREIGGVSIYDTDWVDSDFGGVPMRTLCLASEDQKSLQILFSSLSQETKSQMDVLIKGISFE